MSDVAYEMSELLDEMEVTARARAGDELGQVEGIPITKSRTRSMVHRNGVELPERTRVYDKNGLPSDVPTAQLAHHLSKKTVDGDRAFFSKPPANAVPKVPIEQTCEWCEKRAGRRVKVFYDIDDYEGHCEGLHPREWNNKLRREQQAVSVTGIDGILKLISGLTPEQRKALVE